MSRFKVVVYDEDIIVASKCCNNYIVATGNDGDEVSCGVALKNEAEAKRLLAACVAVGIGLSMKDGDSSVKEFDKFWQEILQMAFDAKNACARGDRNEPLQ